MLTWDSIRVRIHLKSWVDESKFEFELGAFTRESGGVESGGVESGLNVG